MLKAIGRGEVDISIINEMLDVKSENKFMYTLEDARNLILYDCIFDDDVKFDYDHSGVSYIERYISVLLQKSISQIKLIQTIKENYDEKCEKRNLTISKYETHKPVKRLKNK